MCATQPVYTIKSGDGCFDVASANGITLDKLYSNNPNLAGACNIYPGQTLCVAGAPTSTSTSTTPSPTSTQCTRKTTVLVGDDCDTISARAVSMHTHVAPQLNPTINAACTNLIGGTAICTDSALNNCGSVYAVKGTEGGCAGIATALKITLAQLLSLNPNVNAQCTNIYVGEMLCTSQRAAGTPSTACSRKYSLVSGDTCTVAAGKNSLTNAQLLALNPGLSCNSMVPDTQICSFSPATSICPKLVQTNLGDSCFSLAQNVSMALEEWQSINVGLSCNPLPLNYLVCSAYGNATLPEVPSGANPTALPLCGAYDKKKYCCSKFSVSADLFSSPLCLRENANCIGDAGVVKPTASATPTFTLTPTNYPTPTPEPNQEPVRAVHRGIAVSDLFVSPCVQVLKFLPVSKNGCTKNCDKGLPVGWIDLPQQPITNYTFPAGDYSSTGGNPCGVCDSKNAAVVCVVPS
ncbi:hypothetical protein H0H81_005167 [Sphagnurus paluster]|uniref:LysM domain-containing protein n=1 Tax=Sphagnurus paluster TaxID=117069 RepID=A0A9P7K550_9AGAR|nr:hypothetical protein H0H81_005167 [Sphagnurus paluster]